MRLPRPLRGRTPLLSSAFRASLSNPALRILLRAFDLTRDAIQGIASAFDLTRCAGKRRC
jgi:hypothetical protein